MDLFTLCPTAEAAVQADVQAIQNIIKPLGLFRKRAAAIQRFSHDYMHTDVRGVFYGIVCVYSHVPVCVQHVDSTPCSHTMLTKQWRDPQELYGMGKYASDAYWMFCRGAWRDLQPDDKDLKRYHAWLVATDGQGEGLARDPPLGLGT